jgi:squalene-hopene/tetraprenyl-beta-curcumene cyclase
MREAEFAQTVWGRGADPEVMANLLYALAMVDRDRYAGQIERGAEYLKGRQGLDGCWNSTWYHGPYYGTYVCLRLFCQVSTTAEAIRLAADFLQDQQNDDGGWGTGGCSNALDTSLALLGLANVERSVFANRESSISASRSFNYLQGLAGDDGSWPKCEFIRMDTGRATGAVSQILSYGSRTMTTAFVLKAAMAWAQL